MRWPPHHVASREGASPRACTGQTTRGPRPRRSGRRRSSSASRDGRSLLWSWLVGAAAESRQAIAPDRLAEELCRQRPGVTVSKPFRLDPLDCVADANEHGRRRRDLARPVGREPRSRGADPIGQLSEVNFSALKGREVDSCLVLRNGRPGPWLVGRFDQVGYRRTASMRGPAEDQKTFQSGRSTTASRRMMPSAVLMADELDCARPGRSKIIAQARRTAS